MILNGWISPEGKIYECAQMEHKTKAIEIGEKNKFFCGGYKELFERGYLRFYSVDDNSDTDIFFQTEFPYKWKLTIEIPTQKQIMAMGRLNKQLLKEKR